MKDGTITFSRAALDAEIKLPEITTRHGSAKFVQTPGGENFQLGYRLDLTVAPLQTNSAPRPRVDIDGLKADPHFQARSAEAQARLLALAEGQVVYEATADFVLKDADGFALQNVFSNPLTLSSGRQNTFQELAESPIPPDLARRITSIDLAFIVNQCLSCGPAANE